MKRFTGDVSKYTTGEIISYIDHDLAERGLNSEFDINLFKGDLTAGLKKLNVFFATKGLQIPVYDILFSEVLVQLGKYNKVFYKQD